jgi:hypothetical protein
MKIYVGAALFIAVAAAAWSDVSPPAKMPPVESMPPPPSVAMNPAPLDASAEVKVLVNVIPASAKYVIYVDLASKGNQLKPEEAADTGNNLSGLVEQLREAAKSRGANLIVVLGAEHGIDVPLKQTPQLLKLRANDPSLVIILFRWDALAPLTPAESRVRFTTQAPPTNGENVSYKISLSLDTAGISKAYWLYGNISRFIADASARGFDTVALRSTNDARFENVWLPGCDEPVRVSLTKPELDVTIFKSGK